MAAPEEAPRTCGWCGEKQEFSKALCEDCYKKGLILLARQR